MITLLKFIPHHGNDSIQVYLAVTQSDAKAQGWVIDDVLNEAKRCKRHVGVIQRQFGGNTVFSYNPEDQSSMELQLLASLVKPASQVHIEASKGGGATWNI